MEVVVPFFMGTLDTSDTYCDDFRKIAINYLTSLTGFWFDFLTSLPWSLNDLYTIQVALSCTPPSSFIKNLDHYIRKKLVLQFGQEKNARFVKILCINTEFSSKLHVVF